MLLDMLLSNFEWIYLFQDIFMKEIRIHHEYVKYYRIINYYWNILIRYNLASTVLERDFLSLTDSEGYYTQFSIFLFIFYYTIIWNAILDIFNIHLFWIDSHLINENRKETAFRNKLYLNVHWMNKLDFYPLHNQSFNDWKILEKESNIQNRMAFIQFFFSSYKLCSQLLLFSRDTTSNTSDTFRRILSIILF